MPRASLTKLLVIFAFLRVGISAAAQEYPSLPALPESPRSNAQLFVPAVTPEAFVAPHSGPVPAEPCPPDEMLSCIVVLDCSSSMAWAAGGTSRESRFSVAQWGVYDVLDAVPDNFPLALLVLKQQTTQLRSLSPLPWNAKAELRRNLMRLRPEGSSPLADALIESERLLEAQGRGNTNLIVITDGEQCSVGQAHAQMARLRDKFDLSVHVIGVTAVDRTIAELRNLADAGRGSLRTAVSSADLATALADATSPFQRVRDAVSASHAQCQLNLHNLRIQHATLQAEHGEVLRQRDYLEAELASTATRLKVTEAELQCCRDERDQLITDLDAARQQILNCEDKVAQLQSHLDDCEVRFTASQDELARSTSQLTACRKQLTTRSEELKCCRAELTEREERLASLTEELLNCEASLAAVEEQLALCGEDNLRLHDELACCAAANVTLQSDLMEQQRLLTDERLRVEDLTGRVDELTAALTQCHTERDGLRAALSALEADLARTQERLVCCEEHREELKSRATSAEQSVTSLTTRNTRLEREVELKSQAIDQATADLNSCREELARFRERSEQLEGSLEKCEEHLSECRAELERSRSDGANLTQLLRQTTQEKQQLQTEKAEIARRLVDCEHANGTVQTALDQLQQEAAALRQQVTAATAQYQAALGEVNQKEAELANCRLQCQQEKLHLESLLATARQEALGATREMAANKKDCCPPANCGPNPVFGPIIAPTTTPSVPLGGSNPLAGSSPVGGNPVGGASAPVAGGTGGSPVGGSPAGGSPAAGGGPAVGGSPAVGGEAAPGGVSGGTPGGVSGGSPGGVSGGSPGGVSGGSPGGVAGGSPGAVAGGSPGGVAGGSPGAVAGGSPGGVAGGSPGGVAASSGGGGGGGGAGGSGGSGGGDGLGFPLPIPIELMHVHQVAN